MDSPVLAIMSTMLPDRGHLRETIFGVHTDFKDGGLGEVRNNECVWGHVGGGGRCAVRIR
jgi:hypothetical protein